MTVPLHALAVCEVQVMRLPVPMSVSCLAVTEVQVTRLPVPRSVACLAVIEVHVALRLAPPPLGRRGALLAVLRTRVGLLNGEAKRFLKPGGRYCPLRSNLLKFDAHGVGEGLNDVPCLGGCKELVRKRCSRRSSGRR